MKIINCRTEAKIQPFGITNRSLVFTWNIETKTKNWKQISYRICITEGMQNLQENNYCYDSGKINSDHMSHRVDFRDCYKSDTEYYWKVTVYSNCQQKEITGKEEKFVTGIDQDDFKGTWIGEMKDQENHIYRRSFISNKKLKRASLFVSGLGHYECLMNGKKISDRVLEPGWTDYRKTTLYSSYDVTESIKEGRNAIGLILGDGMYNVPGGRYVYFERSYGKMKFCLQLNLYYEDGSKEEIVTDSLWHMAPSPIRFACIYGGEDYDARLECENYSNADYIEDETWESVHEVIAPQGKMTSQKAEPVRVMKIYRPISVIETSEGKFLYDFGVNFSGWVRIKLKAKESDAGLVVSMTPGEILGENQEPDQKVTGRGYRWNYTLNHKEIQEYTPRFSYTGFRYLQVEGAVPQEYADTRKEDKIELPKILEIVGEFLYTDVELAGEFHCSNELFNSIHTIVLQAMKSNMKSVLTDCPHREKLGWLEQSHLIGPGLMNNFNLENLYEKIQQDMSDSQRESGLVPDISPEYVVFGYHEGFVDSPEWGSASIINPWYLYLRYGNETVLRDYYPVMKKYLDYLTSKTHHHILRHGLGDWLDIGPNKPHSQNTPVSVIATTIYYYDVVIMEQVAKLLGETEDAKVYANLAKEIYKEYNLMFYDDQTGRYATGSQAAQAMSLVTGLVPEKEKEKVLAYLVKDIKIRGYATTAGDIGHPFVLAALTMNGKSDIINTMTNITDKPGYGYQVVSGATTLTEEWDGPEPGNPHGSQNHFMLGSIEEWFYNGLAGIGSIRMGTSLSEIYVCPHFAKDCDEVNAWITHPYGKVSIHWMKRDEMALVELTIPPNATGIFVNETDGAITRYGSGYHEIELTIPEKKE